MLQFQPILISILRPLAASYVIPTPWLREKWKQLIKNFLNEKLDTYFHLRFVTENVKETLNKILNWMLEPVAFNKFYRQDPTWSTRRQERHRICIYDIKKRDLIILGQFSNETQ